MPCGRELPPGDPVYGPSAGTRGVRPPGHAPAYLESRIARGDMPDGVLRRDLLAPNDVRCAANHIDMNVGSIR